MNRKILSASEYKLKKVYVNIFIKENIVENNNDSIF